MLTRILAGRFEWSEEVAAMVIWLCSSHSTYINGAVLLVDGGLPAIWRSLAGLVSCSESVIAHVEAT